jgi:hypothetical protein
MALLVACTQSKVMSQLKAGDIAQVSLLAGGWLALAIVVFPLAMGFVGRLWERWIALSRRGIVSAAVAFACASLAGALAPALMNSLVSQSHGASILTGGGAMALLLVGAFGGLGGVADGVTTRDAPC